MNPEMQKYAKEEMYAQGVSAKPRILVPFASIGVMQKGLGFSYEAIIGVFRKGYGDWNYLEKDLKEHAQIILGKLAQNPKYLEEKRQQYNKEVEARSSFFKEADATKKMSEAELFDFLPKIKNAVETTVGTAHMIESISLRLENEIRNILKRKSSGKELNKDFTVITSPVTRSFFSRKEELLWEIKNSPAKEKEKLVQELISKFYWINSSYAGSKPLTTASVLKEAKGLKNSSKPSFEALKEQKKQLFEKYRLSEKEKQLVYWTEFLIDWQDDRKEKILRGVFAIDAVFHEMSRRYKIDAELLQHLLLEELPEAIKSGKVEEIAKRRIQGCVFIVKAEKSIVCDGKDFLEFQKATTKEHEEVELIMGMPASLGTASGTAKIVKTISDLQKVQQGDVLVASMTRPEFVPAMKKAVAIVTDEGGVTCHAAIVSREMGIPCVVGTKIATKVLKDGDIVEVRANHGVVRKL